MTKPIATRYDMFMHINSSVFSTNQNRWKAIVLLQSTTKQLTFPGRKRDGVRNSQQINNWTTIVLNTMSSFTRWRIVMDWKPLWCSSACGFSNKRCFVSIRLKTNVTLQRPLNLPLSTAWTENRPLRHSNIFKIKPCKTRFDPIMGCLKQKSLDQLELFADSKI